jgi:hypothetical protein
MPDMNLRLLARAAPALLFAGTLCGPALAQGGSSTAAPPPGSAAAGTEAAPRAATPPKRPSHAAPGDATQKLVEQRIADLHAKLHIAQAQSQAWDQFAELMRQNATDLDQAYQQRGQRLNAMSAPENLQSYAQIEQTRAQDVQKLVPAFQNLYDSLSAQQKKEADQIFRTYAQHYGQRGQASSR